MANEDQNQAHPTTAESRLFGKFSRRSFLSQLGAAGVAATATAVAHPIASAAPAPATETSPEQASAIPGLVPITLTVNGERHDIKIDPRATLLDTLRETLYLTGTKKGCDHGQCGACTVHIGGRRVNSCLTLAAMHQKSEITTIEGIGQPGKLHPVQEAFVEHDGYQCGYCTSGQIMSAVALLQEPCGPEEADIQEGMSGNICRCGAYSNIIAAVQQARKNS